MERIQCYWKLELLDWQISGIISRYSNIAMFQAAAPPPVLDPGPGNWTDLNQTNCCMLHGGGGGDKAQFCDSLALAGHRTLIVRRRTPADVSVLEQTESSGTGGGCQLKFDIDNITNCLRSASGSSAASSTVLAHTTIFILRAVCSWQEILENWIFSVIRSVAVQQFYI